MAIVKGLKELVTKSGEAEVASQQNRVKTLFVGDGETALIRFIDDEEMIQTKIHELEEMTPTGKKWPKRYCTESLQGVPCKWCAAGNFPKNIYVFLVYVSSIIHKGQNPALNTDSQATKWTPVKQGAQILYKEDVNEIRILRTKFGKDNYLKNMVLKFADEYGTLCDRDYKFSRTGASTKTSYSFVPRDPSPISEVVLKAKKETPHLEDIITGKVGIKEDNSTIQKKMSLEEIDGVEQDIEDLF